MPRLVDSEMKGKHMMKMIGDGVAHGMPNKYPNESNKTQNKSAVRDSPA